MGGPGGSVIKNPPAMWEMAGDLASIPGSGRFLGRGQGNPLRYSCLENPMDRGAWQATVQGVTKSLTQLKLLSTRAHSMDIAQSEQTPASSITQSEQTPASTDADWLRSRLSGHIQSSPSLHADSAKTEHQVLVG